MVGAWRDPRWQSRPAPPAGALGRREITVSLGGHSAGLGQMADRVESTRVDHLGRAGQRTVLARPSVAARERRR